MRLFSSLSFGLAVAFAAACGGKVVVDQLDQGGGGASGSTSNSVSSSSSVTSGGGAGCDNNNPQKVPASIKACSSDADCITENIEECCFTYLVGVNAGQVAAFNEFEAPCGPQPTGFPCECPINVGGEETDDGVSTMTGVPVNTSVACKAGQCMTFSF